MFDKNSQSETSKQERQHQREAGQTALNWQALYTWTQARPVGEVLGKSCTNGEDPLCTYLGAVTQTRASVWSVGPSIKTGYQDRLDKPEWVKRLLQATDEATGHESKPISRELYLTLLESVRP